MLTERTGIHDFGPLYAETDPTRFPVEPFNSISNLIFLVIIVYFWRRTGLSLRGFPLTVSALPILLIGFLGGTIFHATRSHSLWLLLDFIPIAILTLCAGSYFWFRLQASLWQAIALTVLPILFFRWLATLIPFPLNLRISLSYTIMALSILAPALYYATRHHQALLRLLLPSIASFALAITFRIIDSWPSTTAFLPMGSHFLWHLLGGISTWLLLESVFQDEQQQAKY